jgi:hypothetical protein
MMPQPINSIVAIVFLLSLACKSKNRFNSEQSLVAGTEAVNVPTDFPYARVNFDLAEKFVVLTSDTYPKPRKQVSIFGTCDRFIEAGERETALARLITSGPSAETTPTLMAYSKLWKKMIEVQALFVQSLQPPRLVKRISRMDVCINKSLPTGSARYFGQRVEIASPFVNEEQLLHEMGHLLMAQIIGDSNLGVILAMSPTRCNPHSPTIAVDPACAFLEGWGHYVAMAIKKSPLIFNQDFSKKRVSFPVDQNEQLTARLFWILGNHVGFPSMLEALYGTKDDGSCYPKNIQGFIQSLLQVIPKFQQNAINRLLANEISPKSEPVCPDNARE